MSRAALRIILAAVALLGLGWAAWSFLDNNPKRALIASATRIANGETYRPEVMRTLARRAAEADRTGCDDALLLAVATVQARMAEDAINLGDLRVVDERLKDVERAATDLVRCSPQQGIGWLMLFWSRNLQQGFSPALIPLLEASYRASPREAWVAVRRSPVAFSVYGALPAELQETVLAELIEIAKARLVDPAADIMTGPAARYLNLIGPRLEAAPLAVRSQLSRRVFQAGYDVEIPGVSREEARPWRR